MQERPKIGIGVLVVKDGKVLVGQRLASHGSGCWQIPGGHLEYGDTFEETALRELKEETGLTDVQVRGVVSVYNDYNYGKHFVSIGMELQWKSGEPTNAEPDKSANWGWYDPAELPSPMFIPSLRVIENWRRGTIYTP